MWARWEAVDPGPWRKKAGFSLREVARRVGLSSPHSVQRYEDGERETPNSVVMAYEKISFGEVTGEDFARVRRRFLHTDAEAA